MSDEKYIGIELGGTGLPVYGGRVYDESEHRLSPYAWTRAVRDMTANDPVINAFLMTIEMLARQATWKVEPFSSEKADVEQGDFMRGLLFNDMEQTWQETLSEILTFLPWGWSWFEMCYKRRAGESLDKLKNSRFNDGKIGLRKIAIRAQESLDSWEFDEYGDIAAMVQLPPPDYRRCVIPFSKSLHFRTSSKKQNPEGYSILRGAYRAWYFKANIENLEGIGIERDLAGLPVAFLPSSILVSTAPKDMAIKAALRELVTGIKRNEKEGCLFPRDYDDKGNPLYNLELLSTGGQRQFDTSKIVDRWDQRILMSVMCDFLMLGSKATGSFALSSDKTELFSAAMTAWLDGICEVFNRHCFPRINRLNGWDTQRTARLTHSGIEEISLVELGNYVRELSGANVEFDEPQQDWLKRKMGMPITEKEHK